MARTGYFFKRALNHLRRSPVVAGVTVGTVAVVFFVLGIFALVGHNLVLLSERLGSSLQLTVFLEDDCSPEQQEWIRSSLASAPMVEQVSFTSRQQAYSRFQSRLGPQAVVLEGLGENPLPASFEVSFVPAGRDPAQIAALAQLAANLPAVEEVQYGQAWLNKFFKILRAVRLLALIVGVCIFLAALLIVSNTIRLSVFARGEEIHILKLVGATDGFIKVPFYIEGVLLGLLGAILGTAFTWAAFSLLVPEVLVPAGLAQSRLAIQFLPGIGVTAMVGGGALLGFLGTVSSLGRHLKI